MLTGPQVRVSFPNAHRSTTSIALRRLVHGMGPGSEWLCWCVRVRDVVCRVFGVTVSLSSSKDDVIAV